MPDGTSCERTRGTPPNVRSACCDPPCLDYDFLAIPFLPFLPPFFDGFLSVFDEASSAATMFGAEIESAKMAARANAHFFMIRFLSFVCSARSLATPASSGFFAKGMPPYTGLSVGLSVGTQTRLAGESCHAVTFCSTSVCASAYGCPTWEHAMPRQRLDFVSDPTHKSCFISPRTKC